MADPKPKKAKKPHDPNAPKKERQKPVYKETTKLARRQGALVGFLEKEDATIEKLQKELAQHIDIREKAAVELESLLANFQERAAGVLKKPKTVEPFMAEDAS